MSSTWIFKVPGFVTTERGLHKGLIINQMNFKLTYETLRTCFITLIKPQNEYVRMRNVYFSKVIF